MKSHQCNSHIRYSHKTLKPHLVVVTCHTTTSRETRMDVNI